MERYIKEIKRTFILNLKRYLLNEPDLAIKETNNEDFVRECREVKDKLMDLARSTLKKEYYCGSSDGNKEFGELIDYISKFESSIMGMISIVLLKMRKNTLNKDFFKGEYLEFFKPKNFCEIKEQPFDNNILKKVIFRLLQRTGPEKDYVYFSILKETPKCERNLVFSYKGFLICLEKAWDMLLDTSKRKWKIKLFHKYLHSELYHLR